MNVALQHIKDFIVGGPHLTAFMAAGAVFFASMGIGAKWSPWWAWVAAVLSFAYIALRLALVKW